MNNWQKRALNLYMCLSMSSIMMSSIYIYIYIVISTVNICYIAPSHQFLKSVLSFSKPQINFQKIKISRILLSITRNFGCSSYIYIYIYIQCILLKSKRITFPLNINKAQHHRPWLQLCCSTTLLSFVLRSNHFLPWHFKVTRSDSAQRSETSVSPVSTIKRFQMSVY